MRLSRVFCSLIRFRRNEVYIYIYIYNGQQTCDVLFCLELDGLSEIWCLIMLCLVGKKIKKNKLYNFVKFIFLFSILIQNKTLFYQN